MDRRNAWLTPDSIGTGTVIRVITVPVSLLPQIGGAIGELSFPHRWEQFGVTVEETLEEINTMIDLYYTPWLVGAVMAFVTAIVPDGWEVLDGTVLANADVDYPELWDVVPEDWKSGTSIQLPNMEGIFIKGVIDPDEIGETGGLAEVALIEAEMPEHVHSETAYTVNIDVEGAGVPDPFAVGLPLVPSSTGSAGDGDPHENMPPWYGMVYAIFTGRHYG